MKPFAADQQPDFCTVSGAPVTVGCWGDARFRQAMPQIEYTKVQAHKQWVERVALEVRRPHPSSRNSCLNMNDGKGDSAHTCISCACGLQSHHESTLPSQRYRMTRQLPQKLNPIVPQDVAELASDGQ